MRHTPRIPLLVGYPALHSQLHPTNSATRCITNRRRRAHGLPPMYGTGWMAGKPPAGQQNGNVHYYPNQPYYAAPMPAPPYSPPVAYQQTGNTFNSNDGYYGAPYAHGGIELQPPQNVYSPQRGGDPVYSPPPGPPPGKEGQGATFR